MDKEKIVRNINEYKSLISEVNQLKENFTYLKDINSLDECSIIIEENDILIGKIREELELIDNSNADELKRLKEKYTELTLKSENLDRLWNIYDKLIELENLIVRPFTISSNKKINEDIHALFRSSNSKKELENYIDSVCIYMYSTPLLVSLITKDPIEIEEDFEVTSLPQDIKLQIIEIIEEKKREIDNNLILSNKVLISLIENTTGKNITEQQKHNERIPTNYNDRFKGQVLMERKGEYTLLNNQSNNAKHTSGSEIKRFLTNGVNGTEFNRTDTDMLISNFPGLTEEDLLYRSFKSLPNERKQDLIRIVIYNLELCFDMFTSYYANDGYEVPVLVELSNEERLPFNYRFTTNNISHILGIPPTHNKRTGELSLPSETLRVLKLENANAYNVLTSIIENKEEIINKCGLNYDKDTQTYYEMLPWEKIILKTNAFIRGDFFNKPALISDINPKSYMITPDDNITKLSVTPTSFSVSALKQTKLDPSISLEEAVQYVRSRNKSDFTFKGMSFDNSRGFWFPKTNVSAIGEKIKTKDNKTVKTLEKYKYLLEGTNKDSGMVVGVTNLFNEKLNKEYKTEELVEVMTEIADSFGNSKEVEHKLRECLEQLKEYDSKTRGTR